MNGHSPNAWEGSRVMVIGSMGLIGGFIAEASLECGHPTYLLIRPELASLSKASTIKSLQDRGATTIYGSIKDQDVMEKVIREHKIENVISAVGGASIADQVKLVNAIKVAGTVKVINVCYSRVCYLTSYNGQILHLKSMETRKRRYQTVIPTLTFAATP
ncbi:hypothetical protein NC651_033613 [Populus alba x Populus x berolinensis]|nr:hypothetical protein NC651_033613 [Populus alba x Populus x berolinensis]